MIISLLMIPILVYIVGVSLDIGGLFIAIAFMNNGNKLLSKCFYAIMKIGEKILENLLSISIIIFFIKINQ